MAPDTDLRAGTVSHSAIAVFMEPLGDVSQQRAAADGRLPGVLVHGELLEVFEIDYYGIICASNACVLYQHILQGVGQNPSYRSSHMNVLHLLAAL
jgi:hypothetical protein